ncbi:asparagine synthase (glutamine-hydrolyzing) [Verminephrobacter aporrectodeae subsp. tuberculatae]|uniref:asparagine synthase (glutamine-hydrolyzing) n=2 Tax=Verminephrobacter TaxID=364316 RepID=A0ABT3KNX2_9BURK|nr:asparagine synthase (glutamine-hydrolyzing) [Verminephrobacter aporrectodeae]MCW5221426.1 asparagine synthase (glutamine-hydrolyzing) [Verminephrobacter aporrectodeae subsp. tuberculatae]MCW5257736.1 asparagine synthase (glutamine-hydrolyzing) [Verminephrobacter aporrectodeae subsp. tuberculatae]MCW5290717.1 asparagine synthase (glutamine-hydrolyzing) [Verminephrobacter aporrectodeae subsp. tuberculatae]MCW5320022.1 asparagine synthase (glutamine-hydrolyzing) [Verminephrobacter aporrectodeae
MCGIAGVVNAAGVGRNDVWKMINSIRYRGLDEQGVEDLGGAVLGHARLAVVDPENGMQPMSSTDGKVWVVFNGEIFNFIELREQLKARGYRFKSRCDTEVLVHLWCEKGEQMLDDLVGMFAFFIWDQRTHTGLLARDRQGIKPCFYAPYQGGLAFASEMKAILALPRFERKVNESALGHVFTFNYCPPPETCFEGIRHLPPGSFMRYRAGEFSEPVRYWRWPLDGERVEASQADLENALDEAVRLQMRFDVDGGLFLSGGVDSSVIAQRLLPQWNRPRLDAIGLRIGESGFSEYAYAERVAADLHINLSALDVRPADIVDIANAVVRHAEQPHGDFSFFLFYLLSRRAHQMGKIVVFTGDGPDEVMLGFRHNEQFFSEMTRANFPMRSYFDLISYSTGKDHQRIMSPSFLPHTEGALDRFMEIIEPFGDLEPMEQVAAYELTSLMPGNNGVKGDRMGACWSIEARAPFLDHRVSELFARLPITAKFHQGVGKHFLKQAALRYYDRDFVFRPKTMPTLPIGAWIKGPLYPWARDILALPDGGRFERTELQRMLDEHRSGLHNHTKPLRTLLMTKLWLQEFFPENA